MIDFDRLEELTGLSLMPWQRTLITNAMAHDVRGWIYIAGARRGFNAMAHALSILVLEPWRLPDSPRWPRFQLVALPARLEQALDLLIARRSNHARTR